LRTVDHKDVTGRSIIEGDYIVYAALAGRSAVLHLGKVVGLTRKKSAVYFWEKDPKNPDEAPATVQVKGVYRGWTADQPWRANSRIVTLQFPERLAIVPAESVPAAALEAIERVGKT